jgi:integration host factor subunit beta
MVKSELINRIAEKQPALSLRDVELGVNHIIENLSEALSEGKRIEIRGFGSMNCHYRAPRKAHNPKTGERVYTEAKYTPHFKPGKDMRDRVNESTCPIVDNHADADD